MNDWGALRRRSAPYSNLSGISMTATKWQDPIAKLNSKTGQSQMSKRLALFLLYLLGIQMVFVSAVLQADEITVNNLTSFYSGASETDGPQGWPSTQHPLSPPIMAVNEKLYGLTQEGLYSLPATPAHYTYNLLNFESSSLTDFPGMLVKSHDGQHFYGSAATGKNNTPLKDGAVFKTEFDGTAQVLMQSSVGNVKYPNGVIVLDSNETIYGLDRGPDLNGRIFKITQNDEFSILHEFGSGPDGQAQYPNGMILASNGWLYGLTAYVRGIPYMDDTQVSHDTEVGALYRIHPTTANSFEILHTFTLAEGEIPWYDRTYLVTSQPVVLAHLIEAADGYIYGTTSIGSCETRGTSAYDQAQIVDRDAPLCGGSYEPTAQGSVSTRGNPLILSAYPHYDGPMVHGAIYRIDLNGNHFNILHEFNGDDGSQPRGYMTIANDGFLYGTTLSGGEYKNDARSYLVGETYPKYPDQLTYDGTLYRIRLSEIEVSSSGEIINAGFEHLHSFEGGIAEHSDGKVPTGVALAANGNLYGTTQFGGRGYTTPNGKIKANGYQGTVFEVDLRGDVPGASVTVTATPGEIDEGEQAEITWTSNGANNCVASGGAGNDGWAGDQDVQGSIKVLPDPGVYYYTLTCDDTLKGGYASHIIPLRVDAPGVINDGNHVDYGNGAGTFHFFFLFLSGLILMFARSVKGKG